MTKVIADPKAVSVNPLKSSAPLGAAMAYLGVEGSIPLFHGSQGCTAFALVLMVRHFKESIPIQTTAMNEVSTILGGADHVEEALLNLKSRVKPAMIGICTTALVETRGEDFVGDLKNILARRGEELAGTKVVFASTPDFAGALEEGWSKAVTAMVETLVDRTPNGTRPLQVNILPGVHQTPADIDHIRDLCAAFGITPIILPDISGALDGTVPERWVPTSFGGAALPDIARMGRSVRTLAIGAHMRAPAAKLADLTGVPHQVFPTLTGLDAADAFILALADISGRPVPPRIRRERSRLVDAMLDAHFFFGGSRFAIAAEPDLLLSLSLLATSLGAEVPVAVTTVSGSEALKAVPAPEVKVGDLGDMERLAAERGVDLLVTHSHGRLASARLGLPLFRVGFPIFDRLGAAHQCSVGHAGTRQLVFRIANLLQEREHAPTPQDLDPFRTHEEPAHVDAPPALG